MSIPKTNLPSVHETRDEAKRIWTVTKMGVLGLYRSQLPRMAAALAYRTIFSIIPVMAIGLLIFGAIVSDDQVESGVRRVLTFAGISQISSAEQTEPNTEPNDSEVVSGEVLGELIHDPAEVAQEAAESGSEPEPESLSQETLSQKDIFADADIEQVITDLITRVNDSIRNVPTGWIALTSGLVLLYAAMSMLIEIEKSFNQICSAPSGRSWLRRLILYWTILTAGSLLLAATFLAGDAFTGWVISVAGPDSMVGAMMAGYGVSVLISTFLLLGAYLTIPNTRINFRSSLAGAFFAAILWELGKLGFTTYLAYSTGYAKFYGSVAILPLFMMWIYLTWLIVLFGMQASYTLENFTRLVEVNLRDLTDGSSRSLAFIDPLVVLAIAKAVGAGFAKGTPSTAESIAQVTKLDPTQATKVLDALTQAEIVSRIYNGDEFEGWTPSRPTDKIGLEEILSAAHGIDGFRVSGTDDQLPSAIREAAVGACKGKTMADLGDETRIAEIASKPENPAQADSKPGSASGSNSEH